MRTSTRVAAALSLCAVMLACAASDTFAAAGCAPDSPERRSMEKTMKDAVALAGDGEPHLAFQKYSQAESMGACPVLAKECKGKMKELTDKAVETIKGADELVGKKDAEKDEVLGVLCDLFQLQIGWRGHAISGAAGRSSRKLASKKRKLIKDDIKEADREVLALVKEGAEHLKKGDFRSALASYDRIFTTYPYSKKAKKFLGGYMRLREKVRQIDAEEEAERKRSAGR